MEKNQTTFKSDLNARQYRLLDLINAHKSGLTKEEICDLLPVNYPRYKEESSEHYSSTYNRIRADFRAIQTSGTVMGVYGCIHGKYKRLDPDEWEKWADRQWIAIKRKIIKMQTLKRRVKDDQQYRIKFNHEKEIVECFPDDVDKIKKEP